MSAIGESQNIVNKKISDIIDQMEGYITAAKRLQAKRDYFQALVRLQLAAKQPDMDEFTMNIIEQISESANV